MAMPQTWQTYVLDYITGRANKWTAANRSVYLLLATADPGLNPVSPADIAEVTTAGYARQVVTWSAPAVEAIPSSKNTAVVNIGPFTSAMSAPATHAALVTTATGTTGEVIYTWAIPAPLAAGAGETIQVPVDALAILNNSNA